MSVASLSSATAEARRQTLRGALPALLAALLAWGVLFHAEIEAAVRVWIESRTYNHCFFILPLAFWLAWDRRGRAAGLAPAPTLWPVLAVLPLGVVWFAADRLGIMEGRQLAALFMVQALLVGWLGWRLARVFAGPIAYLIFLVPFGAFITPALQDFTARFVDIGLAVIGIPHVVTDLLIEIPQGRFFIAEACAGLRFLVAAVAFGALYSLLLYRSPGRRIAFVLASCVVPVIANGFRALGIVTLGYLLGSAQAAATDHVIYGWGFFSVVILLLTAAGLPFRQDTPEPPVTRDTPPLAPRAAVAWSVAALMLVFAAWAPAVAARLDRPRPTPTPVLPRFVAAAGCQPGDAGAPDEQRFTCGTLTLLTQVQVLPPGINPAALRDAREAATDERSEEQVTIGSLSVPGVAPAVWRLVDLSKNPRLVAQAAYLDGGPVPGGLRARVRLALDALRQSGGPAVIVTATLSLPDAMREDDLPTVKALLRDFLRAQAAPLARIAQATRRPAAP